eukprot:848638-Prymnesium_polylepis.3
MAEMHDRMVSVSKLVTGVFEIDERKRLRAHTSRSRPSARMPAPRRARHAGSGSGHGPPRGWG